MITLEMVKEQITAVTQHPYPMSEDHRKTVHLANLTIEAYAAQESMSVNDVIAAAKNA